MPTCIWKVYRLFFSRKVVVCVWCLVCVCCGTFHIWIPVPALKISIRNTYIKKKEKYLYNCEMKVLILHYTSKLESKKGDHLFPVQLPNTYIDK